LDARADEGVLYEASKEERRHLLAEQNKNMFKQKSVYF